MKLVGYTVSMVHYMYNVSHICTFTFSSSYILKSKKKLVKLILIIFYFTQYRQILSFQYIVNILKLLMRCFTFFSLNYVFEIWGVFYIYGTSQIRLATF